MLDMKGLDVREANGEEKEEAEEEKDGDPKEKGDAEEPAKRDVDDDEDMDEDDDGAQELIIMIPGEDSMEDGGLEETIRREQPLLLEEKGEEREAERGKEIEEGQMLQREEMKKMQ